MWNARLDESQARIKIAGRNTNNLSYADDTTPMAETKEDEPLDEGERGKWNSWLRIQHSENEDHGIWSHHFMANRREKVEATTDFIFLGSKITADDDCSQEIKACSLEGKLWQIYSILKSRNITWLTKLYKFKPMVFPVVMYGCESWTIEKAEHGRIDDFEL